MNPITFILISIIAICTVFTVLFNSLTAKLGRVESSQNELENNFKKRFELIQLIEAEANSNEASLESGSNSESDSADTLESGSDSESDLTDTLKSGSDSDSSSEDNPNTLQEELAQVEESLRTNQESFTTALNEYNDSISRFPCILVARILGFMPITDTDDDPKANNID